MGFSRQEYWSRLLCPPPGDVCFHGLSPCLLSVLDCQVGSLPLLHLDFHNGSVGIEFADNLGVIGNVGWSPGLERSPGEGNGNGSQYSCLGNAIDSEAWWAIVHGGCKELDLTEWPSRNTVQTWKWWLQTGCILAIIKRMKLDKRVTCNYFFLLFKVNLRINIRMTPE